MKRGGGGILPPQNKTIIFIYLPRLCPAFSSHLTSILTAYSLPPGSAFLPKALLYYKNLVKTICTQQMQEQQLAVHTHGGKMRWESLSLGRTMRGEWSVHRRDSGVVLMSKVKRTSSVQQIRGYRGKDRTGNPTLERTFEISQIPSPQDFSQNQITAGDFPRTFWLFKWNVPTVNTCTCQEERKLDGWVCSSPSRGFREVEVGQVSLKEY